MTFISPGRTAMVNFISIIVHSRRTILDPRSSLFLSITLDPRREKKQLEIAGIEPGLSCATSYSSNYQAMALWWWEAKAMMRRTRKSLQRKKLTWLLAAHFEGKSALEDKQSFKGNITEWISLDNVHPPPGKIRTHDLSASKLPIQGSCLTNS